MCTVASSCLLVTYARDILGRNTYFKNTSVIFISFYRSGTRHRTAFKLTNETKDAWIPVQNIAFRMEAVVQDYCIKKGYFSSSKMRKIITDESLHESFYRFVKKRRNRPPKRLSFAVSLPYMTNTHFDFVSGEYGWIQVTSSFELEKTRTAEKKIQTSCSCQEYAKRVYLSHSISGFQRKWCCGFVWK